MTTKEFRKMVTRNIPVMEYILQTLNQLENASDEQIEEAIRVFGREIAVHGELDALWLAAIHIDKQQRKKND